MKKLEVTAIQYEGQIYLISDDNSWIEGWAYHTDRNEVIYYNGDYGETRPKGLKRVVALPAQIGYKQTGQRVVKNAGYPVDFHTYYVEIRSQELKDQTKYFVELDEEGNIKFISEKVIIHYE